MEPDTTPVWAAATLAARAKATAEVASLAKELVPPDEHDLRIFPSMELWDGTAILPAAVTGAKTGMSVARG
jgi:hypothetical protein